MGGRRARWLKLGVALALLAPGIDASALTDTQQSPVVDVITAESILQTLGSARTIEHAFTVPGVAECAPLERDLSKLDQAFSVDGVEYTSVDNLTSFTQDVYEFETVKEAASVARDARPKSFLDCTRATFDPGGDTFSLETIPTLHGRGDLLGDAKVFFSSGGLLEGSDGTTASLVTSWIVYDKFVTRLSTRVPGSQFAGAKGALTTEGANTLSQLFDAATNILWGSVERRPLDDAETSALQALGLGADPVPGYRPPGPPTDLDECRALVEVENREFPVQYAQLWQSQLGSFTQISRGFGTNREARRYYDDLRGADFRICYAAQFRSPPGSTLEVTLDELAYDVPKPVLKKFGVREFDYFSFGGQVSARNPATNQANDFFAYTGVSLHGSAVRLYFADSSASTSWDDFVQQTATLVTADIAAD